MNNMQFSVDIHAGKETVWATLWHEETFRDWASIIDQDTYMVGELKEGNEVQFISAHGGYGVRSLVHKLIDDTYVMLKHKADTQENGTLERSKEWTGGEETYELVENEGTTTLTVTVGVPPQQEEYFKENYPKALARIKELSEKT